MIAPGFAPAFAVEKPVPESGTWRFQEALETGSLTPDDFGQNARIASPGDTIPVVEGGGTVCLHGIDTH